MARPAKFDDLEVLDRASDLFWRDGCDAVTIRDLEAVLDLRAPSIYRRFTTKDGLVAASIDRYVDRVVRGRVRRYLERADDPVEGLRAFFSSVLEPHPGEPTPRGCLLTVTAGQRSFDDPTIRAGVVAGLAVIESAFRTQVERAQAAGQVRGDLDPVAVAVGLLASFEGLLVLARAGMPGLQAGIDASFAALTARD